ncbi:MAG: hypothetical protein ACM3MD_04970 [Betaproteobacteria bacterium]
MNRIEKKDTAPWAAKLFEEEVREINPDTPREVICDMVDDYLYYQQDDLTRDEAHMIVEETCIKKRPRTSLASTKSPAVAALPKRT